MAINSLLTCLNFEVSISANKYRANHTGSPHVGWGEGFPAHGEPNPKVNLECEREMKKKTSFHFQHVHNKARQINATGIKDLMS